MDVCEYTAVLTRSLTFHRIDCWNPVDIRSYQAQSGTRVRIRYMSGDTLARLSIDDYEANLGVAELSRWVKDMSPLGGKPCGS